MSDPWLTKLKHGLRPHRRFGSGIGGPKREPHGPGFGLAIGSWSVGSGEDLAKAKALAGCFCRTDKIGTVLTPFLFWRDGCAPDSRPAAPAGPGTARHIAVGRPGPRRPQKSGNASEATRLRITCEWLRGARPNVQRVRALRTGCVVVRAVDHSRRKRFLVARRCAGRGTDASKQTAGPLQVCRLAEAKPAAPAPFGHAGTRLVQCVIVYRQRARWVDG